MKTLSSLLILAGLSLVALPLQARIERNVEKSFTVAGTGTLRLETSGGAITVKPGADGVVKIVAHERIRADSDAEADSLLKNLELTFDQNGNDVRAAAKYDRGTLGFHFGSQPVQVDFTAEVPAAFATDLHTSGGSISIGDLAGVVNARTSGGNIKLGKLGGKADVRTSGGGIALEEARGEVKLDTSGGNISVGRVAGPADLSTSGGSISIDSVEQRVNAHTSGGNIRATLVGPLKGDCVLSTSGGSVRVTVDKSAAFQLDASTSGGGVTADGLTITLDGGHHSKNKLSGAVNGGGPLLKLRTSGGSISVQVR
jgi:hypothetical protein